MDRFDFTAHSSSPYNSEMASVHRHLTEMGRLVLQQVDDALRALLEGDLSVVRSVLEREDRVDTLEKIVDEGCASVLARRQPAATDLRLLIAASKCVANLERVGDEAVKVAVIARELIEAGAPGVDAGLAEAGAEVSRLLATALSALSAFDAERAVEVIVDGGYRESLSTLAVRQIPKLDAIPHLLNITWALRSLERIGDHAHNIAEQVIYLVTGRDVRHLSVESIAGVVRP